MDVLVTGGLGAIGSWVVRELVASGHRPVVFDVTADTRLVVDVADRMTVYTGSVTNLAAVLRIAKAHRVRRAIHLAALMPPACYADPADAIRVNVQGTVALLEAAQLLEWERLVYFSSKAVYGEVGQIHRYPTYQPVTEEHPLQPTDIYGTTKLLSEQIIERYRREAGLDVITLRMGSTFGPGKTRHGSLSFYSEAIGRAHRGLPVRFPREEDWKTDLIYNADVGRAAVLACFAGSPRRTVFNIASGRGVTLVEFRQALQRSFPQVTFQWAGLLELQPEAPRTHYVMDTLRAREDLGFEPGFTLEQAMAHFAEMSARLGLG